MRFNEEGNTDKDKSEFNYKPRIIKALSRNLELNENSKDDVKSLEMEVPEQIQSEESPQEIISLKPRIIKAIGH